MVKVLREDKIPQEDVPRLESSLQILRIFIVEAASRLSDWCTVVATIEARLQFLVRIGQSNLILLRLGSISLRP